MKTFLFDTFNRYKRFSESLDVETILCNKTWFVFNNSGEREIYIFQENGKLKISLNGKVTHATWEYIPANRSLIISGNEQSYMVHAAYVDNILFALQVDGTNEYAFLIDENSKHKFQPQSYNDIKHYFYIKEQKLIQKQESERLEKERLLAQKIEEEQEERQREEKRRELWLKACKIRQTNVLPVYIISIVAFIIGASVMMIEVGKASFSDRVFFEIFLTISIIGGIFFIHIILHNKIYREQQNKNMEKATS